MPNNYYVGLVHHPVYNKNRQIVTTSVTNMDIHDISRICCTFGITKFLIINPLSCQEKLVSKITDFWQGKGRLYQQDRAEALEKVAFVRSCEEAIDFITIKERTCPIVITTTAKQQENQCNYDFLATNNIDNKPKLVLFGTGYGLTDKIHQEADYVLKPIKHHTAYNHLSVRSAVAIVMDRLLPKT